jgi:hypothetical protein
MVSTSPSLNHNKRSLAAAKPKDCASQCIVTIEHEPVDGKQPIAGLEPNQAPRGLRSHVSDCESDLSVGIQPESHPSACQLGDDVFRNFRCDDFGGREFSISPVLHRQFLLGGGCFEYFEELPSRGNASSVESGEYVATANASGIGGSAGSHAVDEGTRH